MKKSIKYKFGFLGLTGLIVLASEQVSTAATPKQTSFQKKLSTLNESKNWDGTCYMEHPVGENGLPGITPGLRSLPQHAATFDFQTKVPEKRSGSSIAAILAGPYSSAAFETWQGTDKKEEFSRIDERSRINRTYLTVPSTQRIHVTAEIKETGYGPVVIIRDQGGLELIRASTMPKDQIEIWTLTATTDGSSKMISKNFNSSSDIVINPNHFKNETQLPEVLNVQAGDFLTAIADQNSSHQADALIYDFSIHDENQNLSKSIKRYTDQKNIPIREGSRLSLQRYRLSDANLDFKLVLPVGSDRLPIVNLLPRGSIFGMAIGMVPGLGSEYVKTVTVDKSYSFGSNRFWSMQVTNFDQKRKALKSQVHSYEEFQSLKKRLNEFATTYFVIDHWPLSKTNSMNVLTIKVQYNTISGDDPSSGYLIKNPFMKGPELTCYILGTE